MGWCTPGYTLGPATPAPRPYRPAGAASCYSALLSAQPPVLRPSEAEGSTAKRLLFYCAPVEGRQALCLSPVGARPRLSRPLSPLCLSVKNATFLFSGG